MEPSSQPQAATGVVAGEPQVHVASNYPPATRTSVALEVAPLSSQPVAPLPANPTQVSSQHHLVYQQVQQVRHQLHPHQQQQLQEFWTGRMAEIEQNTDFKSHRFPIARIKRIMKADRDVHMVSADAPMFLAKACELFIMELTLRSWMHTEENKRRTLMKHDIIAAITGTETYDFLLDILPRGDMEEGVGLPSVGGPSDVHPYYYIPQQEMVGAGMVVDGQQGDPVMDMLQDPDEQEQQDIEEQQPVRGSG